MKKLTQEEFLTKVKIIHGDLYDYSMVKYAGMPHKIQVICREHGEFSTQAGNFSRGSGCPKCAAIVIGGKLRDTGEDFIFKARKLHGDTYDYSLVEYTSALKPVTIVCRIHGLFDQLAATHVSGSRCPSCASDTRAEFNRQGLLTKDQIISQFREIHGDKYNYSFVNYVRAHDKVEIVCPKHGSFFMAPIAHKKGQACPQCYNETRGEAIALTKEEFLARVVVVHGTKYDYSRVTYSRLRDKIDVVCTKHGLFNLSGDSHLYGKVGCPICSGPSSGVSRAEMEVVDYIKSLGLNVIPQYRYGSSRKTVDIFIPDLSLAIEYDGLYWHSSKFKNNGEHLSKRQELANIGIHLLRVFENEWLLNTEKVKLKLKAQVQTLEISSIKQVSAEEAHNFYCKTSIDNPYKPLSRHFAAVDLAGDILAVLSNHPTGSYFSSYGRLPKELAVKLSGELIVDPRYVSDSDMLGAGLTKTKTIPPTKLWYVYGILDLFKDKPDEDSGDVYTLEDCGSVHWVGVT